MNKKIPKLQSFVDFDWIYNGNDDLKLEHWNKALNSLRGLANSQEDKDEAARINSAIDHLIKKLEE